MSTQLPPLQTQTAQEMAGANYRANEPLIGSGESNPILPSGFDQFSLTEAERKEYGIKDAEDHAWIRYPDFWKQIEMKDRGHEWVRGGEGRRVIRIKGEVVSNGDLMLVAKPKSEAERMQRISSEQTQEYLDDVQHGDVPGAPRWRPGGSDELRTLAEDQHNDNVSNGLIGPTSGLDFDVVAGQYGKGKVQQEQAFYRNGGMHVEATDDAVGRMEATQERAQAARRGKASTGWSRDQEVNAPAFMKKR